MPFHSIFPYSTTSILPSVPLAFETPYKALEDKRPQLQFDHEVEKVSRRNRKAKTDMEGNHEDHYNYGKDLSERTFYKTISSQPLSMMQNTGQFRGLPTKEPFAHLKKFLIFANMVRINVSIDTIHLRLFPFSIADKEPLGEAWERFMEMLRRYPHHDFSKGQLI
ncbi:hypothetical protein CR513_04497, partial [Mucuna pruriens]